MAEQMGLPEHSKWIASRTDGMTIGHDGRQAESMNEFTRLDLYAKIFQPPGGKIQGPESRCHLPDFCSISCLSMRARISSA